MITRCVPYFYQQMLAVTIILLVFQTACNERQTDKRRQLGFIVHSEKPEDKSQNNDNMSKPRYNFTGTVRIVGDVPQLDSIKVSGMKKHCNPGLRPNNALIVSRAGELANAVVYIMMSSEAAATSQKFTSPAIDQKLCTFVPHVQFAALGSKLLIKNNDPTMHSVHASIYGFDSYFPTARRTQLAANNTFFKTLTPAKNMTRQRTLSRTGLLKLVCDFGHSWMRAYVWVVDHPFYALSDSSGRFTIPQVPSGTWQVRIWHEYLGNLEKTIDLVEDLDLVIEFGQVASSGVTQK